MKKNYTKKITLAIFTIALSISTYGQIIADGTYKIFNQNLNQVVSINRVAQPNPQDIIVGRAVMANPDAMEDDQLWTFTHQGNDIYKIVNVGNTSNLGIKDGWCGQFGDVQATFADGDTFNVFRVVAAAAADSFTIQIGFDADCNFGSTNIPPKALDIDGGNSGAKLNTFDVDSANLNQTFRILEPNDAALSNEDDYNINFVKLFYSQANRTLLLEINESALISKTEVIDIHGKIILANNNFYSEGTILFDFSAQSNGMYFVRIESEGKRLVKKVIVY